MAHSFLEGAFAETPSVPMGMVACGAWTPGYERLRLVTGSEVCHAAYAMVQFILTQFQGLTLLQLLDVTAARADIPGLASV